MKFFNESEVKEIIDNCFNGANYKKDIVKEIGITKYESKNGTIKEIVINRASANETDFKFNEELEKVTIPKNTKNGTIIKLLEKGNQYKTNEPKGNLYIKIHIFGKN
jgi:DnaJ-class molecular chaperone